MKKLYGLLALAGIAAGSAWGQDAVEADAIARAKALLHSASWSDKAWGAYFSTGLRSDELSDALLEELRLAEPLRHSTWGAEEAFVQSLLDALIQSGKAVPTDAVLPFEEQWRAETLILLSHGSGNEETLLDLRKEKLNGEEWVLVSNLLFRMRSGRFFASILQEKTITHTFHVTDTGGAGGGGKGGFERGGCGPGGMVQFLRGFPPIGRYGLTLTPQTGDVVVAEGPKIVYYRRIVVTKNGQAAWGECSVSTDPEVLRTEYLAAIGGILNGFDVPRVRNIFEPWDYLRWQNAEQVAREMKARLQAQVKAIRDFVNFAGLQGWSGAEGLRLRITPVVVDDRRDAHEALPAVAPVEFTLE
jgi:hypothetical protein